MSADLREPLHDLASEVPAHVTSGDLATTAWAAGRRRRLRRSIISTGMVLALIAIVVGSLLTLSTGPRALQPAGRESSPKVGGYPERIVHQWWTPTLPSSPGPVAGLLERPFGRWDVVTEHGHLWRSPVPLGLFGNYPSLSFDGRYLGYLAHRNGPYVVRDLATGRTTRRYRQVSCGCSTPTFSSTSRYWMEMQAPTFWSPDDQRLIMIGGTVGPSHVRALLLEPNGQTRPLRMGTRWIPAGWAGPTQLVWADHGHRTTHGKVADVEITDLSGHPSRTVRVHLPPGTPIHNLDQWSWVVSPNGRQLLLTARTGRDAGYVATYSLRDGATLTSRRMPNLDLLNTCPSGWAGTTPVVPLPGPSAAVKTVTATASPEPIAVTDPRLGSECVIWASDALSGAPHGGLFGTATATWTWWWREALAGIGATALIVIIARAIRRRRRTHASTGADPAP